MLNNKNHSSCTFAGQIVSYIYDEATAAERKEFETHLPNCISCADEIAGFGLVRSSINEWRKDEFFTLESPALKIPALLSQNPAQTVSSEKISWFENARKIFTISPAWVAGFAVLIICIGLVWMFFGSSKDGLVADAEVAPVAPIVESNNVSNPTEEKVSVEPQDEQITENPKQDKVIETKVNPQTKQVVKAANTTPKLKPVTPKTNNTMAENKPNNRNNKSNYVQKQTTPTLSDMSEEEDKSLRLSELFEEIGGTE